MTIIKPVQTITKQELSKRDKTLPSKRLTLEQIDLIESAIKNYIFLEINQRIANHVDKGLGYKPLYIPTSVFVSLYNNQTKKLEIARYFTEYNYAHAPELFHEWEFGEYILETTKLPEETILTFYCDVTPLILRQIAETAIREYDQETELTSRIEDANTETDWSSELVISPVVS